MFNIYVPGFVYRTLPWVYIATGIVTVFKIPGVLGTISGMLLVIAGALVLKWRTPATSRKRARPAARPLRQRARRPGNNNRPAARADRSDDRSDDSAPPRSDLRYAAPPGTSAPEPSGRAEKKGNGQDEPAAQGTGTARPERRRSSVDRRGWQPMPQTPFLDSKDVLVTKDRRKTPDRRRGNIVVEEL